MKQGDVTTQDEAVILPANKCVAFTRDMTLASGTQAITGVGFRPSSVIFLCASSPALGAGSVGLDDTSSGRSAWVNENEDITDQFLHRSGGITIEATVGNPSIRYFGNVQSFDVDGITIIWTRGGAATGTLLGSFMAFK